MTDLYVLTRNLYRRRNTRLHSNRVCALLRHSHKNTNKTNEEQRTVVPLKKPRGVAAVGGVRLKTL
jgi:hypothetical protein